VDGLYLIREKERWTTKDYEERELPLPDFLVAALKERMLRTKGKLSGVPARQVLLVKMDAYKNITVMLW
jgi:hypothetical protein